MKRCRCRSLLLPTTRIGTSLLLPSLQGEKKNKKGSFQEAQLSSRCLSQWLPGRMQDVCVQLFLLSEVCGGGLEDYSSQAQGASHHTLQRLVYWFSIIVSVKLYGKPEVGINYRFRTCVCNPAALMRNTARRTSSSATASSNTSLAATWKSNLALCLKNRERCRRKLVTRGNPGLDCRANTSKERRLII